MHGPRPLLLLAACSRQQPDITVCLAGSHVQVMQYVVCPSHFEWLEYEQQLNGWREDAKVINEPAIAGMLDQQVRQPEVMRHALN